MPDINGDPYPSETAVSYANDRVIMERAAHLITVDAANDQATLPAGNVLAAMIDARWELTRDWGAQELIDDNMLKVAVRRVFPPPPPEV